MSLTDIIEELPNLSHAQRRELCQRIIALEAEQDDLAASDLTALQGFMLVDKMEAEDKDAGRKEK